MKRQQEMHSEQPTFAGRLKSILDDRNLDAPGLARKLDIAPSSVYNWLRGSVPHRRSVRDVARVLGVNEEWLSTGIGPKVPPDVVKEVTAEEFRKPHPDFKRVAMALIGGMPDAMLREKIAELTARNEFDAAQFLIEELKQRTGRPQ